MRAFFGIMSRRVWAIAIFAVSLSCASAEAVEAYDPQCIPTGLNQILNHSTLLTPQSVRRLSGVEWVALSVEPGRFGGQRVMLGERSIFDPRGSVPYIKKYRFQSSLELPYTFQFAVDQTVAEIIGFGAHYIKGERIMSIPNRADLQGFVDLFNSWVSKADRLPVHYVEARFRILPRQYLTEFAETGAIPIANKGHYFIHDVTAHAGSILYPPELIAGCRKQIHGLLKFEDWLKANRPGLMSSFDFDAVLKAEATRVDFSTANAIIDIARKDSLELAGRLSEIVNGGKSPAEYVATILEKRKASDELKSAFSEFRQQSAGDKSFFQPIPKEVWSESAMRARVEFINATVLSHFPVNGQP